MNTRCFVIATSIESFQACPDVVDDACPPQHHRQVPLGPRQPHFHPRYLHLHLRCHRDAALQQELPGGEVRAGRSAKVR